MVKYTLEQCILLYDNFVTKKSYKLCKRRFCHTYPDVRVPTSSVIVKLEKKVCSSWSFLDKTYTGQNAVLTEAV
jgi:hypothetical protein